jgi:hypothetical protein
MFVLPRKARRRVSLLAALLLLLMIPIACVWLGQQGGPAPASFALIRPGMTLDEVRGALGPSAELSCLATGGGTEQHLVIWKGGRDGMIYLRGGTVRLMEPARPKPTSYDRLRQWWFRSVGTSPPF